MSDRHIYFAAGVEAGEPGALLSDGTLWSHAVCPGTYVKDEAFTIGDSELSSFVKNFKQGYPSKVPVDYEHGSTNGATLAGQPVPKAGDVVEMLALLSAADIPDEIQTTIDRTTAEWKALGSEKEFNPLGLWVRWRPTPKALKMLKDREYTEMSICFSKDIVDNTSGEGHGPGIKAIALTARPFVDGMIPIAASADAGGTGAAPRKEYRFMKWFSLASVLGGKPVTTEAEGEQVLSAEVESKKQRDTELTAARELRDVVVAEFGAGVTTPAQAIAAIRKLRSDYQELSSKSEKDSKSGRAAAVELALRPFEPKLTVPAKEHFSRSLSAEMERGVVAEQSDTIKVLKSLPDLPPIAGQSTHQSAPGGEQDLTDDKVIMARTFELASTDPAIKDIPDHNARLLAAATKANAEADAARSKKGAAAAA
jgi:phage I-like protein